MLQNVDFAGKALRVVVVTPVVNVSFDRSPTLDESYTELNVMSTTDTTDSKL